MAPPIPSAPIKKGGGGTPPPQYFPSFSCSKGREIMFPTIDRPIHTVNKLPCNCGYCRHTVNKLPCHCGYCTHCQQTSLPLWLLHTLSANFLATVVTAHTVSKLPCHCSYCTHCQQTSLQLWLLHTPSTNFLATVL